MAANGARRTLQFSSSSVRTLLSRSSTSPSSSTNASKATNCTGFAFSKPATTSRFCSNKFTSSKLPVELGAGLSLMPLHSVTASALFTSLLSLNNENWGCLSEGFATPL